VTAASPAERVLTVLAEVAEERVRQDARWGEQNHPDGTGPGALLFGIGFDQWAHAVRQAVDRAARAHRSEWASILLEEVFEALAEGDPVRLRVELVQVAAVAVSWAEAIDRRQP
jgi:hypothetical protein